MIKFFRKIRQQTLSQSKFRKYVLYAIGEIFLVVIGILIALQINNYNEALKEHKTVQLYLKNFVADLNKDVEIMEDVMKAHSFRYHSMQYLLTQIGEDIYDPTRDEVFMPEFVESEIWMDKIPEEYNKEFIGLAFLWSHRAVSQNLTTTTIDELKSTGIFSHIDNIDLKIAINDYYDYWSHRLGDRNQTKFYDQINQWEASLGEDGLFTNVFYELEDPLNVIRNNEQRIYLLKQLVRESAWIVQVAIGVKEYSEGLAQYIQENYLNLN